MFYICLWVMHYNFKNSKIWTYKNFNEEKIRKKNSEYELFKKKSKELCFWCKVCIFFFGLVLVYVHGSVYCVRILNFYVGISLDSNTSPFFSKRSLVCCCYTRQRLIGIYIIVGVSPLLLFLLVRFHLNELQTSFTLILNATAKIS